MEKYDDFEEGYYDDEELYDDDILEDDDYYDDDDDYDDDDYDDDDYDEENDGIDFLGMVQDEEGNWVYPEDLD